MAGIPRSIRYLCATVLSGLLLWLAWPERGFTALIFIAFIPMLWVQDAYYRIPGKKNGFRFLVYTYPGFLIWNGLSTWWIWNASPAGALVAIGLNSLFMSIVWLLALQTRKQFGTLWGYCGLILYWIAFEYLHLNWEISWPWLNLGNVFSTRTEHIQWYEYTGALGGSFWVLCMNILFFLLLKSVLKKDLLPRLKRLNSLILACVTLALFFIPLFISHLLYKQVSEQGEKIRVAVVQPNIDPYHEKFNGTGDLQLAKILQLSSTVIDDSTRFLIAPETALPDGIWEDEIYIHKQILSIRNFLKQYPQLNFIAGLSTYKAYKEGETPSTTARKFRDAEAYYDAYNSAMMLREEGKIQLYHKSKLVPGVEKMPYPKIFGFLENYAIELGGTSGSLGGQEDRINFVSSDNILVAPAICYESVYGGFMSNYIRGGATFIAIITNDGWWGNTPGYRQHMQYARLRAVEFRRSIVRSANTGISCIINQRGDIVHQTEWWVEDAFNAEIRLNTRLTFYARHGDYIGFIAAYLSIAVLAYMFIRWLLRR